MTDDLLERHRLRALGLEIVDRIFDIREDLVARAGYRERRSGRSAGEGSIAVSLDTSIGLRRRSAGGSAGRRARVGDVARNGIRSLLLEALELRLERHGCGWKYGDSSRGFEVEEGGG